MSYYFIEASKNTPSYSLNLRSIVNYTHTRSQNSKDEIAFKMHNHDIFEVTAIEKGTMIIKIDEVSYELCEGDIIIANPYELHEGKWRSGVECEYTTLTCPLNSFLYSGFGGMKDEINDLLASKCGFKTKISASEPFAKEITNHIKDAYVAKNKSGAYNKCAVISHTFAIFSLLFEHYYRELPKLERKNNKHFFKSVTAYLEENYQKKIGTADISAALYMSKSQFCHNFRKYYNNKFSSFLCYYRVVKAAKEREFEEKNLTDIAREVGFTSYQYFARAFKEHIGCSPSEYFKSKKETAKNE